MLYQGPPARDVGTGWQPVPNLSRRVGILARVSGYSNTFR